MTDDATLATYYTDNDLRYALDKAASKTEVAVLPLSSGLAKDDDLKALRLILDHLPKEHWQLVSNITQLRSGDVYMVTGRGWEYVSQLSNDPRVVDIAVWHPRTGISLAFGDILTKKLSESLYRLEQDND